MLQKYIILNLLSVAMLLANAAMLQSAFLGIFALGIFFLFSSCIYGNLYGNHRYFFGFITVLCLIIIGTSLSYFLYKLNMVTLFGTVFVVFFLQLFITRLRGEQTGENITIRDILKLLIEKISQIHPWILQSRFLLLYGLGAIAFTILFLQQTSESIVSPWTVVPTIFFIIIFLLAIASLVSYPKIPWSTATLFPLFLISAGVAAIIYMIGYGFDQFVHEAALHYIDRYGIITPKTPYYIGQYGLEMFLIKLGFVPLSVLNRFLVPVAFGLFVPSLLVHALRQEHKAGALFFLLVPVTPFIATTPQGFANIFLIALIFTAVLYLNKQIGVLVPTLLAVSTILIHPIAGLPAMLFLMLCVLVRRGATKRFLIIALIIISLFMPIFFLILSQHNPAFVQLAPKESFNMLFDGLFNLGRRYNFWVDLVYFSKFILPLLLGALTVFGVRHYAKRGLLGQLVPFVSIFIIFVTNGLFIYKYFAFPSLIFYEQADFAFRFINISFYFLLPIILAGGALLYNRIEKQTIFPKIIAFAMLAFFITSTLYLSYPRRDAYASSHGYSPSAHDIRAVRAIHEDAGNESYVVLANQAVGAAALREFGFFIPYLKTMQEELYFYSIPTGGALYKYYLQMAYDFPNKDIAQAVKNLTGVHTIYFVLNDYWWNSKKIAEIAKGNARSWQEIDSGKVFIFKY